MPFCIKFVCDKGTDCEKKIPIKAKKNNTTANYGS